MDANIKGWIEVIDEEMPQLGAITEKARERILENAAHFRGSMRISTGRFWTDAEYQKYREKVLNTPLP